MVNRLGPVMVDIASTSLDNSDRAILEHPHTGGVVLFARNLETPAQTRALCDSIRAHRPELLISVDHEGGRVQRLREGMTHIPPMSSFGPLYREASERTLALVHECGWLMSQELAACGFDFTFAPVLDVDEHRSKVIGERAFSGNPEQVAILASHLIDGLNESGMAAIGKHFPGHGGVEADSHLEMPVDERSFAALEAFDIVPFARLVGKLAGIMPSHVRYPAVDQNPTGFSAVWLDYLRNELNFRQAIVSDDMNMQGAHFAGGPVERARLALAAGCDSVLMCNDRSAALAALDAVEIDPDGSQRLEGLRFKGARPDLATLQTDSRWQHAHEQLTTLAAERGY